LISLYKYLLSPPPPPPTLSILSFRANVFLFTRTVLRSLLAYLYSESHVEHPQVSRLVVAPYTVSLPPFLLPFFSRLFLSFNRFFCSVFFSFSPFPFLLLNHPYHRQRLRTRPVVSFYPYLQSPPHAKSFFPLSPFNKLLPPLPPSYFLDSSVLPGLRIIPIPFLCFPSPHLVATYSLPQSAPLTAYFSSPLSLTTSSSFLFFFCTPYGFTSPPLPHLKSGSIFLHHFPSYYAF